MMEQNLSRMLWAVLVLVLAGIVFFLITYFFHGGLNPYDKSQPEQDNIHQKLDNYENNRKRPM